MSNKHNTLGWKSWSFIIVNIALIMFWTPINKKIYYSLNPQPIFSVGDCIQHHNTKSQWQLFIAGIDNEEKRYITILSTQHDNTITHMSGYYDQERQTLESNYSIVKCYKD